MPRIAPSFSHVLCIRASGYPRVAVMFLRKVLFLSTTVQAEVECYMVDRICSHDVCYVASYLIVCLFRRSYGVIVTKCVRVGKTLRSSKFRHGKTYALELDDEQLACCVVLGAIFDAYV